MRKLLLSLAFWLSLFPMPLIGLQTNEQISGGSREEEQDYFGKWLNEDVVYIITPDERDVFESLTTPEEKEQFIEQFWFRRDPDPRTVVNEFREEHYRRIAYANEHFSSGFPGWRTDRGRIYIVHGPPDEIESFPSGGRYERPAHEGGGTTVAFPFEKWWYRNLPGVGSDVELEFVDPTMSGEYRLALRPEEKDALLNVPGAGLTWAEERGLAEKRDRPYFYPGGVDSHPYSFYRAKDNPFTRYETYALVQRPREIKYKDLRDIVEVNVVYNNLPFRIREDYFNLNTDRVLVLITLKVDNRDLTFREENGVYNARLAVYGVITDLGSQIVAEFEDDVLASYPPAPLESGLEAASMYQKVVSLAKKMKYKLTLVLKDLNTGHVGVIRRAIIPPSFQGGEMITSSLLLADLLVELTEPPGASEMFVIGDVKVRPSVNKTFPANGSFGVYFQIYNVGIDQATVAPTLRLTYTIFDELGKAVWEVVEERGESMRLFPGPRVVVQRAVPTTNLQPGNYRIQIRVQDRLKDQEITLDDEFRVSTSLRTVATR